MVKVAGTLLILNVLLKVDGLVEWTWMQTLWPLYLLMIATFMAALVSLFMLLNWFCGWVMSKNNTSQAPGKLLFR